MNLQNDKQNWISLLQVMKELEGKTLKWIDYDNLDSEFKLSPQKSSAIVEFIEVLSQSIRDDEQIRVSSVWYDQTQYLFISSPTREILKAKHERETLIYSYALSILKKHQVNFSVKLQKLKDFQGFTVRIT